MGVDKFFCKTADEKVTDKQVEFPSEKEANEYCRENGIDPHNVILMGDKYIVKTKDSGFRTTMDEAISACDMKAKDFKDPDDSQSIRRAIGFLKNASSVLFGVEDEREVAVDKVRGKIDNIVAELERM